MALDPLGNDEVAKLVESRVKSAGVDWKCSDDVSQSLLDQFNGNPGETIVQLRDYVDGYSSILVVPMYANVYNNMKNQSSELDPLVEKFNDEIIDIVANDDEESVDEIVEQEKHREQKMTSRKFILVQAQNFIPMMNMICQIQKEIPPIQVLMI